MPDLGRFVRRVFACALLRFVTFSMPTRRLDRVDLGIGVPPISVRTSTEATSEDGSLMDDGAIEIDLLDGLGDGRWTFRGHRLRNWRNKLSLHRGVGQLQP